MLNIKPLRRKFFTFNAYHRDGRLLAMARSLRGYAQSRKILAAAVLASWSMPGIWAWTYLASSLSVLIVLAELSWILGAWAFFTLVARMAAAKRIPLERAMARCEAPFLALYGFAFAALLPLSPSGTWLLEILAFAWLARKQFRRKEPELLSDWELKDRLPADPFRVMPQALEGKGLELAKRTVAGQTRNCAAATLPSRWSMDVDVPAGGAALELAAAVPEDTVPEEGIRVRVELGPADGSTPPELVFERRLDPLSKYFDREWKEARVDLSPYASRKARATFSADGPTGIKTRAQDARVLWPEPIVLGRGHARPDKIIVIVIDACRPDMLSCLRSREKTSPAIDSAFSRNAALFDNAFTQSVWTAPCFGSIFTSLYPSAHGVYPTRPHSLRRPLSPRHPTFPEILRANGFVNAAFVGHTLAAQGYGFARGFDQFTFKDNIFEEDHSYWITTRGIEFLKKTEGAPSSLFLHYFDSHYPYFLRSPYDGRFGFRYAGDFNYEHDLHSPHAFTKEEESQMARLYRGAVLKVDQALELLFNYLRQSGQFDDTLLVLTSDHGLQFFDRYPLESGHYGLQDEYIRAPLLIKYPARLPMRRVGLHGEPVEANLSVAPTILDALGLDAGGNFSGASLGPWLRGERDSPPKKWVISESLDTKADTYEAAVRDTDFKYIYKTRFDTSDFRNFKPGQAQEELYDLKADPGERTDLAASRPETRALYRKIVEEHAASSLKILQKEVSSR